MRPDNLVEDEITERNIRSVAAIVRFLAATRNRGGGRAA